jgi:hypothetical protein
MDVVLVVAPFELVGGYQHPGGTYCLHQPISVAARSKAYVFGRMVARVAGSNPIEGMDVCLLCLYVVLSCVGRGLC